MKTRFGSKVAPIKSTGDGWLVVEREDGSQREWHIGEMILDGDDTPEQEEVIQRALLGEPDTAA